MRAVEGPGLDRRGQRGRGGSRILEVGQLEFVELRRVADKDQRRCFTVVDGDETVVTAQVGGVGVVARLDPERQFALSGDCLLYTSRCV